MSDVTTELLDLSNPRRVHVVGVGGPGMSAVALTLADMGHEVSGSDTRETDVLSTLRSRGVRVSIGHNVSNVRDAEAVTYSTAIPLDNVEIVAARSAGAAVMHRSGMLAAICARANAIGVAGTHGKTTTSAMLLAILQGARRNPSYVIGAEVLATGMGAQWTGGELMIVEADESDGTHDALPLRGTIITNIDRDHLDYFGSLEREFESFLNYARRVQGPVVLCADDPLTFRVATEMRGASSVASNVFLYGLDAASDACISRVVETTSGTSFTVTVGGIPTSVSIPSFGLHNVLNATAALSMAHLLGVSLREGSVSLAQYGGVERRFQVRGEARGCALVDDYAHLPAEIEAALAATRQRFPGKRVVAVFQPNRFHRIQAMAHEYATCFGAADHVVITDVYASGTPRIEGVTGQLVVDAVVQRGGHHSVSWCETRSELIAHVVTQLNTDSVCISMGCGDIERLPDEVLVAVGAGGTAP